MLVTGDGGWCAVCDIGRYRRRRRRCHLTSPKKWVPSKPKTNSLYFLLSLSFVVNDSISDIRLRWLLIIVTHRRAPQWNFSFPPQWPKDFGSLVRKEENLSEKRFFSLPLVVCFLCWGVLGSPRLGTQYQSAEFHILATVGCKAYNSCSSCIQDPNCGWCVRNGKENRKVVQKVTIGSKRDKQGKEGKVVTLDDVIMTKYDVIMPNLCSL